MQSGQYSYLYSASLDSGVITSWVFFMLNKTHQNQYHNYTTIAKNDPSSLSCFDKKERTVLRRINHLSPDSLLDGRTHINFKTLVIQHYGWRDTGVILNQITHKTLFYR